MSDSTYRDHSDTELLTSILNCIFENFYNATGLANAVLDMDGHILSAVGWQDICTRFHRVHEVTAVRCQRSDTILANKLLENEKYAIYTCENGMTDAATPIVIDGEHVANVYLGQFFFTPPDREFFRRQAEVMGFDQEEYLKALDKCQIYSVEYIHRFLDFLSELTNIVVAYSTQSKKQRELISEIEKRERQIIEQNEQLQFMKGNLETMVQQRTAELERVQLLLKSSLESPKDMMILSIDTNYGYNYFNQAHKEMMRSAYQAEIAFGRNALDDISVEEERIRARKNYDRALAGESHSAIERYGRGVAGYFETFYNPIMNEEGKVIGATAFSRDISDRILQELKIRELNNTLETRVAERTVQLETANHELETFSYSVSHDLKAPVRHVSGYVSLLKKKYRDNLPDEGRRYLENIEEASENMGRLIDGLLEFSRKGRIVMHPAVTDMEQIVESVVRPIRESDADRKIVWTIDPLPRAYGDVGMLQAVWSNLIENAVKFTKYREEAHITIGAFDEGDEVTYYVKDNGAGFDMKYAAKLFEVFQRLHQKSEFEGTGIGLATVRKMLQRQGGRIWAEGAVDEGAGFYFTLKKGKDGERG